MAHLISFTTDRFDISAERPNPTNPIAGQSVLLWLREGLSSGPYRASEPDTEDWGWYMEVEGGDASYLVGASGEAADPSPSVAWVVQVHKRRSIKDKVLGRNKLAADDPLFELIERLVRSDAGIVQVAVERGA